MSLVFYHAPHTRSSGTLTLLEELGAPYELKLLNMKAGEQRQPAYLAVNPMGKVPAIVHDGALVTKQVAIYIYLADLFPQANLAPALTEAARDPYLRWMAFYGAAFEPAVMDFAAKRDAGRAQASPYGDYNTCMNTIGDQLAKGPYILGDTFSAADVLWGTALTWTVGFKVAPEKPAFLDYIKRVNARAAFKRAAEKDAQWAKAQEATPPG